MGIEKISVCDYCRKQKGEANKWWIIRTGDKWFSVAPFHAVATKEDADITFACSSTCLNKAIDTWCHKANGA